MKEEVQYVVACLVATACVLILITLPIKSEKKDKLTPAETSHYESTMIQHSHVEEDLRVLKQELKSMLELVLVTHDNVLTLKKQGEVLPRELNIYDAEEMLEGVLCRSCTRASNQYPIYERAERNRELLVEGWHASLNPLAFVEWSCPECVAIMTEIEE